MEMHGLQNQLAGFEAKTGKLENDLQKTVPKCGNVMNRQNKLVLKTYLTIKPSLLMSKDMLLPSLYQVILAKSKPLSVHQAVTNSMPG